MSRDSMTQDGQRRSSNVVHGKINAVEKEQLRDELMT
jgi:hypothetical protein